MPHGKLPFKTTGNLVPEWNHYRREGGTLSLSEWSKQRRQQGEAQIAPPAQLSPRAFEALATLTPEERARLPFPIPEEPLTSMIARRTSAEEEAAGVSLGDEDGRQGFKSFSDAFDSLPNENWEVFKNEFGLFDVRRKQAPSPLPTGLTPSQQAQQQLSEQEFDLLRQQFEFQQQQAGVTSPFQQQQLELQQQQISQQQSQFQSQLQFQQQQFASQLAANPINWLQYAAFTGQPPVVQPFMSQLGFQDPTVSLQTGQPIPGFQPATFQGNVLQTPGSFTNLPALTTPSAQFLSRLRPSERQQFAGFRRARTGRSQEDIGAQLASQRAPTGSFAGFSSFR